MSSPNRVIVIGAGIAGPVIAIFLKNKGFEPIVFESHAAVTEAGLSLMLQPNGLKVLKLIPGLLDRLPGVNVEAIRIISLLQDKLLINSDGPSNLVDRVGFPMRGVPRVDFQRLLVDVAQENGIEFRWSHKLVNVEQSDSDVTATFENGETAQGNFLIGCDGLHSATRTALFGKEKPSFTGLTQTGGWSKIPQSIAAQGKPALTNFFGDGFHIVGYIVKPDVISWALTRREEESRETWSQVDTQQLQDFKDSSPTNWPYGASDIVQNAFKLVKYGLYDRPELKSWHKGRVVLLGDAAHPTSPHLGQGANQAFEDIYHLIRLLGVHSISPVTENPTSSLEAAFKEYEALRISRTSTLVQKARYEGDKIRVVNGAEACKQRDEAVRQAWEEKAMYNRYQDYSDHPYKAGEEI